MSGKLYLAPTPLDHGTGQAVSLDAVLPAHTLRIEAGLTHWICENAKSARAFLGRVDAVQPLALPLRQHIIVELPRAVHKKGDHDPTSFDARPLLAPALDGNDVGLISEAGMPAVADPGSSVVRAAHDLGLEVVPLTGPVSILLALAASGLNGQQFAFNGYLPQAPDLRATRLRQLEGIAWNNGQTQLFIETPYRNAALLRALAAGLKPQTRLAISSGLTLAGGWTQSQTAARWRAQIERASGADELAARMNRYPSLFAIGR
ncbi:MAG: SAM-dependent methyltransferase [Burkholderiaceae bacterium]|jgi:16S rRNA (cytidine1402-2'-O)-methyltransferase|nr:SAM-dependent methyltransferase [Burkholderiaceae bacterium]